MSNLFIPEQTIGIIGGGYLARLLSLSAKSIGFQVGILAPRQGCPASEIADWQIVAAFDDEQGLMRFAEKCDVLIIAQQQLDVTLLRRLQELVSLPQSIEILEFQQNRLLERRFLEASNLNIAPYAMITKLSDIEENIDAIGFPCILKGTEPREGVPDQFVMQRISDIRGCLPLIRGGACMLEAMIPFEKELTMMIAGNGNGEFQAFPIVETIYDEAGNLERAQVPSTLPPETMTEAYRLVEEIAVTLNVQGVLTVDLFVTEAGMIYVHSIASGPHDAAHYTMEASNLSQFDAHIRGVCGWQIPPVTLYSPAISLKIAKSQLLGTISQIPFQDNWYYHYYGKNSLTNHKWVGHVTVLTKDLASELKRIDATGIWTNHN